MNCIFARPARRSRNGMVLIVVLVAIMMLSLAGYTFSQLMFAEREAAWAHGQAMQAQALAHSGVGFIEQQLVQSPAALQQQGGWYDNATLFRGVLAADGGIDRDRGRFTILSPRSQYGAVTGFRYGLEDESSRLNLNTLLLLDQQSSGAGAQALLMLPGMTPDVADAILDWIDPDETARQNGAERDVYSGQSPSYAPKNGPLESVEELLLVRGVTPMLLFGMDADRNGVVDAREASNAAMMGMPQTSGASGSGASSGSSSSGGGSSQSGGSSSGGSSSSGSSGNKSSSLMGSGGMNQGWAAYLTVHSMESNLRANGQLKINLNSSDLNQLYQDLSTALDSDSAMYVVAYRQGSVTTSNQPAQSISGRKLDLTKPGPNKVASPLDFVGAKVQVTFQGESAATIVDTPFSSTPSAMAGYLPKLLDNTTIVPSPTVPGRINVNQAPAAVLLSIPKLDGQTVDRIISGRPADPSQANSDRQYPTWLYVEGLVDLNTMKQIMPFVTSSGRVFRAQVVGHFDRPGPTSRIEAIIDATTPIPRLLFWRDLTHLGRGYGPTLLGQVRSKE
jgi:type II secretory pathway component PulK